MKQSMGKKLLLFTALFCMIWCMFPTTLRADGPTGKTYVALGDSISTGAGLANIDQSFVSQVAAQNGYDLTNLAQDGETTASLVGKMSDPAVVAAITSADVITISIGGNDMMNVVYDFVAQQYNEANPGANIDGNYIKTELQNKNMALFTFTISVLSNLDVSVFSGKLTELSGNFMKILASIRTVNAKAEIIILNQYNPYRFAAQGIPNMEAIVEVFENGISMLNAGLVMIGKQYQCVEADVHGAFASATQNPCNASFISMNLDFHPNAFGHGLIAEEVNSILGGTTVPSYDLLVVNGTGTGSYEAGTPVIVTAEETNETGHFTGWTASAGTFEESNKAQTAFIMPSQAAVIKANYEAHVPDTDDGDCTTPVLCEVCKTVVIPAQESHTYADYISNGNDTHTGSCINDGCSVKIIENCTGGSASYFVPAACSVCGGYYGKLLPDVTSPVGKMTQGDHSWDNFQENGRNQIYKQTMKPIVITGSDDSYSHTGFTQEQAVTIEYYIYAGTESLGISELEKEAFCIYTEPIELTEEGTYVVYARITDHAGNTTYMNSDFLTVDQTAPVLTGIDDGKTYCQAVDVTVYDENLAGIWVNGIEVTLEKGQMTLEPSDDKQTIEAVDKNGNCVSYTITVNRDHTLVWNEAAPATCTAMGTVEYWHCSVCDANFDSEDAAHKITEVAIPIDSDNHDLIHHEGKEPTRKETGWKAYDTCSRCDYTTYQEIAKLPAYMIESGADGVYVKGSKTDLIVKADGNLNQFTGIKVDSILLDKTAYTAESGSTVVKLKAEYLDTISVGIHTLTLTYEDGEVSTEFTVKAAENTDQPSSQTGDEINMVLWIGIMIVCSGILMGSFAYIEKSKQKKKK